jgi:quinol monooxygenase YgiN
MSINTQSVTVLIACPIVSDKMDLARREFTDIISTVVTKESACHSIRLQQDLDDPYRLLFIEEWDSKEAFTGPHMQTPHMQAFLQRAQGFLAGAPEFRFGQEIAAAGE